MQRERVVGVGLAPRLAEEAGGSLADDGKRRSRWTFLFNTELKFISIGRESPRERVANHCTLMGGWRMTGSAGRAGRFYLNTE